MTVIAARLYRHGQVIAEIDIDKPIAVDPQAGEFVWIGLYDPAAEELATVGSRFGLHPLALEDAQQGLQLPKVDVYGDQLFLILRTAQLHGDKIGYGETSVFVGPGFIVSVRHSSARAHSDLRAQLEATPRWLAHGPDFVLHSIIDFIVDGYFPVIEAMEDEALAIEASIGDRALSPAAIRRLFTLRREIMRFLRVLGVMSDVAGRLVNVALPNIDPDMLPYFRDVLDHVRRAEHRVAGLREILTSVVETSSMLEQLRQGDITRKLAAWAAILAVPTAVAGVYGMNFDVMPELRWRYGYFVVLSVMVSVCTYLFVRFRRTGWL
jgi:magnesium transporter